MDAEKKPRILIKRVKAHSAHHGGAWKVAYADFVTAMMALFLVLWLTTQASDPQKKALAQYFRDPGVFETTRGGILDGSSNISKDPATLTSQGEELLLFEAAQLLRNKIESNAELSKFKDQIKIDITDEGLRIQILDKAERVSFDSGSAELTSNARAILAEIAHVICTLPNPLKVGGHTDKHVFPSNSNYTNWELSADRANAARRELETNCVKPQLVQRIVGYADTELLVKEDPFAPANRRISIIVMRMISAATDKPLQTPNGTEKTPKPKQAQATVDN